MSAGRAFLAAGAALGAFAAPGAALATSDAAGERSVAVVAETQDLSEGEGSRDTLRGTFRTVDGDATVVLGAAIGERRAPGVAETGFGLAGTLYYAFDNGVSTRTHIAIADDSPVFASRDIAQDVTFRVLPQTTATLGVRWARYFGSQDVYFISAGARRYFEQGSVSYRLSYVSPDGRDSFAAHLVNVVLNDANGDGRTQLWLSAGAASFDSLQIPDTFSGEDYGAMLRRVQPLTDSLNLIASLGMASYDRPGDRVTSTSVGLGVEVDF